MNPKRLLARVKETSQTVYKKMRIDKTLDGKLRVSYLSRSGNWMMFPDKFNNEAEAKKFIDKNSRETSGIKHRKSTTNPSELVGWWICEANDTKNGKGDRYLDGPYDTVDAVEKALEGRPDKNDCYTVEVNLRQAKKMVDSGEV